MTTQSLVHYYIHTNLRSIKTETMDVVLFDYHDIFILLAGIPRHACGRKGLSRILVSPFILVFTFPFALIV